MTNERDTRIYEAVMLRGRPAVEVAAEFRLAATTVRNIAFLVQRNLARSCFELMNLIGDDLLVKQHRQLTAAWHEAMEAWHESKKEGVTRQIVEHKDVQTRRVTTRTRNPNPRYLKQALQAMLELRAVDGLCQQRGVFDQQRKMTKLISGQTPCENAVNEAMMGKFTEEVAELELERLLTPEERALADTIENPPPLPAEDEARQGAAAEEEIAALAALAASEGDEKGAENAEKSGAESGPLGLAAMTESQPPVLLPESDVSLEELRESDLGEMIVLHLERSIRRIEIWHGFLGKLATIPSEKFPRYWIQYLLAEVKYGDKLQKVAAQLVLCARRKAARERLAAQAAPAAAFSHCSTATETGSGP